ncbi:substrate-binding periplasmic protein [Aquabacterium humicola]|uniref:substrate-binding periplasmic protein n=1 Tax=Aquabacterium humicola TaxID=3237377 RepID=UPI002543A7CA|nr:transporter substrate-binding domain-containing protein [Rubrivivax pictus]
MRRRRFCSGLLATLAGPVLAAALADPALAADETPLERIRRRGSLVVGVYQDMPPFHVGGAGIDVELARALAAALGVQLSLLPFHAGENMDDDLRSVVWRGHYLGWGPADVLLHVPVEPALMAANPRVQVLAPYYRERVAIARRRDALPALDDLSMLRGRPVAVAGQSLPGWLLIGADGGALRETLQTRWPDGSAAAVALRDGLVVAAAGLQSELESTLRDDPRFAITPLPAPRAPRDGWAIGCAVRKEASDLGQALQQAMRVLQGDGSLGRFFAAAGVTWRL